MHVDYALSGLIVNNKMKIVRYGLICCIYNDLRSRRGGTAAAVRLNLVRLTITQVEWIPGARGRHLDDPPYLSPYSLASTPLSSTIAALASGGKMSFSERFDEIRTGFERPFWVANITELFERLSYYAVFASLSRYLHQVLSFPPTPPPNLPRLFAT